MSEIKKVSYKNSGVDVDLANQCLKNVKQKIEKTYDDKVIKNLGNFAGLYDISGYKNPILLSSTDGVGTKLEIAISVGYFEEIGIDCVAMCVNDLICHGAKPLLFLDYFATGKLNPKNFEIVVSSIIEGCKRSEAILIGGETAEMPGFYKNNDFDIAGFSVGICERENLINFNTINSGDKLLGLASSGFHSNGYSLVRKIITDYHQNFEGKPIWKTLLKATTIYYSPLKQLMNKKKIKGIAHITGGGISENLLRIVPENLTFKVEKKSWKIPSIFKFIASEGVSDDEMYRIFNMGVGMILVVDNQTVFEVQKHLETHGVESFIIGKVIEGKKAVCLD